MGGPPASMAGDPARFPPFSVTLPYPSKSPLPLRQLLRLPSRDTPTRRARREADPKGSGHSLLSHYLTDQPRLIVCFDQAGYPTGMSQKNSLSSPGQRTARCHIFRQRVRPHEETVAKNPLPLMAPSHSSIRPCRSDKRIITDCAPPLVSAIALPICLSHQKLASDRPFNQRLWAKDLGIVTCGHRQSGISLKGFMPN